MPYTSSRVRSLRRGAAARLSLAAVAVLIAACGSSTPTGSPIGSGGPSGSPGGSGGPTGSVSKPWLDTSLTVDQRVASLLSQMTLDEKIGQMTQLANQDPTNGWQIRDPGIVTTALLGSVLSGGDGNPKGENTAENWYAMVSGYQQAALATRLAIPILYGADMVHGASHITGTTVFPHNIGLGATHDAPLVQQVCQVTAIETAAAGVRWTFGPVVAVPQDVRWGRTYEGYSENTDLVSQLGTACVEGLQGNSLSDPNSVVADPKHFLGDGGTTYGSSTQNNGNTPYLLDQGVDRLDDATIQKLFLPPYQNAVKNGARIVMVSYSSTQAGGKMSGNKHWLTDVLKTQLSFTGFVVSDWDSIDQIDPNDYSASVKAAINAGIDMAMMSQNYGRFLSTLKGLVQSGDVPQSRIDDAVTRILRVKFEMGLFENPMPGSGNWSNVGAAGNRAVAARAVSESAVLLKTSSHLLPLATGNSTLLAGQGADDLGVSSGGWTLSWQGKAGNATTGTTLKAALQTKLGSQLTYNSGGNFGAGTHAAVGIVVVAERPYAEGVGDSATLQLPAGDLAVIAKVRPLVDKLIVVIMSGRPVMLSGITGQADAVVAAWLPGTENEGIADVLFGTKPFTGTTPYTWPKTAADAPRIGKSACQGAVYPYGYGLKASGALLGPAAC
jgi:beta-glucosidase